MIKRECEQCKSDFIQLFTSWACPNACEKKLDIGRRFKDLEFMSHALISAEQVLNHHALVQRMEKAIIRAFGIPKQLLAEK